MFFTPTQVLWLAVLHLAITAPKRSRWISILLSSSSKEKREIFFPAARPSCFGKRTNHSQKRNFHWGNDVKYSRRQINKCVDAWKTNDRLIKSCSSQCYEVPLEIQQDAKIWQCREPLVSPQVVVNFLSIQSMRCLFSLSCGTTGPGGTALAFFEYL